MTSPDQKSDLNTGENAITSTDRASPGTTPMMRQYHELKEQAGDAILLFRMGDFYEIFGADAEEVAPKLEVVLTSREKGEGERVPFCGVPHHSAKSYWLKLLRLGYKVAIAEQTEDPAQAKGLVKRAIVRVMTPGCIEELEGLDHDAPNYLVGLYEVPSTDIWAIAAVDISTGEFRLGNCKRDELSRYVVHFQPKELVARRFAAELLRKDYLAAWLQSSSVRIESLPEGILRDEAGQQDLLKNVFGRGNLDHLPCGTVRGGEAIAAGILQYLKGLQAATSQFLTIKPLLDPQTMLLGETAIRDLELFETARRRQTDGSLMRAIDRTRTPMGARLLRHVLGHPYTNYETISSRHAAVASFVDVGENSLTTLREHLRGIADVQRLSTRVLSGNIHPAELGALRRSLLAAEQLALYMKSVFAANSSTLDLINELQCADQPLSLLRNTLVEDPSQLGFGHTVFAPGYDAELDAHLELTRSGEAKLAAYEARLKEETGINSLKVRDHKTFGVLIEVTKANLSKVPSSFIRRQTMVNCERFVTIELRELGDALAQASDKAVAREAALYLDLLRKLANHRNQLSTIAAAFAEIDLLQGFAWLALRERFCRPSLSQDGTLLLQASRHPVIERFVGTHNFVPNDIAMSRSARHLLITGPNMAGKSTVMRQTAIAAILCQAGCFVPAAKATMPVFDRIFTRVGASDDLSRGHSTFMVEMTDAAEIVRQSTNRSLVILDEVGRGTSTTDGLAIAAAILEFLVKNVQCYSLFATHYHELVPIARSFIDVAPMQTEVVERNGKIHFTHRLTSGACRSSFGIEVARLAGLPDEVIKLADTYLEKTSTPAAPHLVEPPRSTPTPNLNTNSTPLIDRLAAVRINRTTPLQALNILNELKELADGGAGTATGKFQGGLFDERLS